MGSTIIQTVGRLQVLPHLDLHLLDYSGWDCIRLLDPSTTMIILSTLATVYASLALVIV